MITKFKVRNYKALREVDLDLTPIHVLIGPNDSGKTSILEALAALSRSVDHPLGEAFTGFWDGRQLVWNGDPDLPVILEAEFAAKPLAYRLASRFPNRGRGVVVEKEIIRTEEDLDCTAANHTQTGVFRAVCGNEAIFDNRKNEYRAVYDCLAGVHTYRWDSRLLALPVAPDSKRRFRMESSGFGLALCLDDILGFDRQRFTAMEQQFTEIFPKVRSIKLCPEPAFRTQADDPQQIPRLQPADGKGIYFQFAGSDRLIPAAQASDGVLLILAYLAVCHLPEPPRLLLVEEPENGIHPRRLQVVMDILRRLSAENPRTQIVLTTHSPYALDRFQPEEVTVCTRTEAGAVSVSRLSESPTVREQLSVFTLGEIWTAEGDEALSERPLAEEGQPQ